MKNKILLLLLLIFYGSATVLQAQDLTLYKKNWLVAGADTMPFRVLLPLHFDSSKVYPLVLVLHGGGERGSDNEMQLTHGAKLFVQPEVMAKYPAIVVFPQCSDDSYWSNVVKVTDSTGQTYFSLSKRWRARKKYEAIAKAVGLYARSLSN